MDALYFEGQPGAGIVNISGVKFESRVSTTKHKHCIALRPHSSNGSGTVVNIDGVIAYALGGSRDAVVYNYNGTSRRGIQPPQCRGPGPATCGFKSHRYRSRVQATLLVSCTPGTSNRPDAQIQVGSSLIVEQPLESNPNGVVAAPRGSMYLYTGGTAGSVIWMKETGSDNQGWVAK